MDLTGVGQITSWGFYLRVSSARELVELLKVRPEYVCRGFMDWGWPNADYRDMGWVVDRAHQAGILFEGGISYSPVRPPRGQQDLAGYDELTTCNPLGVYASPASTYAYRQGAIHNPATREWFLDMARAQLDAGVDGIHIDEIECHYPWRGLGFDRYALAAFRDWLVGRYAVRGWAADDPRWQSEMGVDLALHGGSMDHFDFLRHLQSKGLLEDAAAASNEMTHEFRFMREDPVGALWGNPWFERYAGTFQFDLVERYWGEAVIALKEYAAKLGRQVIVNENMNGCARPFADYTMAHGGLSYHDQAGRFSLSLSCAERIRSVVAESRRRAGAVPVVFFLDWGHTGSDMDSIPPALRRDYIAKLAAECAAEGVYLALPINGEGYNAAAMGYLDVCAGLAALYREQKRLYLRAPTWAAPRAETNAVTVRGYQHASYAVVHAVNHAVDASGGLAARNDARIWLPADSPRRVRAWSAEWQGSRQVALQEQPGGSLVAVLPPFRVNCALELNQE